MTGVEDVEDKTSKWIHLINIQHENDPVDPLLMDAAIGTAIFKKVQFNDDIH